MFNKKIFQQLGSLRYLRYLPILFINGLLIACTSPNVETDFPPPVEHTGIKQTSTSLKSQLFQTQGKDVTKAFYQYEKSGYAPIIETDQIIKIPFGQTLPVINCLPLRTCDLKLEIGERITGVYPGDTSRWLFEEALSGEGVQQQMHVIFKPKEENIITNAIITTSKRTYHVELHSQKDSKVKQVEFYFPDDIKEHIAEIQKTIFSDNRPQQTLLNHEGAQRNLDFNYRIEISPFAAKPIWTPLRVFNDGVHVYIQIPQIAATSALPALFIMSLNGQYELVNYRVQKPYYIVDELFQQAVLKIVAGQDQQQVKIIRNF
jgi:P-type conjugative transfer protein TrbG